MRRKAVSDVPWTLSDIDTIIEIANNQTGFTGFVNGTVVPAKIILPSRR
jgi:hypothetical protein